MPILARLLTVFLAAFFALPMPAAESPFSTTIKAVQETVKSGSEVRIGITLTNISDGVIQVFKVNGSGQAELGGFDVDVQNENGKRPSETQYHHRLKTGEDPPGGPQTVMIVSGGFIPLKPGESMKDEIVATRLFDLSAHGSYKIQVEKTEWVTQIVSKSNTITVTVTP